MNDAVSMPAHVRLYISPLTSELLPIVLSATALTTTSDISYHTIQTFPERNYGYVELPTMEAEKVKKKLNGSILKGSKVRVEAARPQRKGALPNQVITQTGEDETDLRKKRPERKRKRDDGVLAGYELPKERKVRRGWTEPSKELKDTKVKRVKKDTDKPKDKQAKVQRSSYTDKPECLFRTKLPSNVGEAGKGKSVSQEKPKKRKTGKTEREAVIHEFSNTTKHAAFLRENQVTSGKVAVSEYIDSKGWVDKDGKIIESATTLARERSRSAKSASRTEPISSALKLDKVKTIKERSSKDLPLNTEGDASETSSSGISSSAEDDSEPEKDEKVASDMNIKSNNVQMSGGSSAPVTSATNEISDDKLNSATPKHSSVFPSVTSSPISSTHTPTQETSNIHPLEALFKRPKSKPVAPRKLNLEVQTSFSFFDPDPDDETTTGNPIPQTPFTAHDTQQRRLRSAAPTPDTAAPGKVGFEPPWALDQNEIDNQDEENDEGNEGDHRANRNEPSRFSAANPTKEGEQTDKNESEFSRWFWAHRGETNRAWKRRRREASKEKRQRENRRSGVNLF